MKITLDRAAFTAALDRVGKVIEKRNTIPILSHALIEAPQAGGSVSLTGTDLDMEVRTLIEAQGDEVEAAGKATFPMDLVSGFVRKLPAGKVTLALESGRLTLRSGRSRITVPSLEPGEFPQMPPTESTTSFDLEAAQLIALIERVSFAISTEETRYCLNGIYLHAAVDGDDAVLRAVATDGHRLARHQLPAPQGAQALPGIIIPRKAVAEIARLAKPLGAEKVRLEVSPTRLRLEAGTTTLTTKLIDGTFPDYARVIPSGNGLVASLDAEALAAAVERVSAVSTERGRAVKFTFGPGRLALDVTSPDTGTASDELDMEWSSPDALEIGFNGRYVADILAALPAPSARLALADAGSPCLITSEAAPGSLFVLMPMRV